MKQMKQIKKKKQVKKKMKLTVKPNECMCGNRYITKKDLADIDKMFDELHQSQINSIIEVNKKFSEK